MIHSFQSQQPGHRIPLNRGAQKVFDEAAGVGLVPEVEDRYEDMAADFLEKWLVSSDEPFSPEPTAQTDAAPPNAAPAEKPVEKAAVSGFEPQMSSFNLGLDWQLSDGRTVH
jgi:hypothetical protein